MTASRIVERIAVGIYGTHEAGSAVLDSMIQLANAAYESVAVRLTVATAEEGDGLAGEVGTLQHFQTVVPVVLQLAGAPCRGAKNEILVVAHYAGREILYVDGLTSQLLGYLLCDSLARSCRGTENYNCCVHFYLIF